MRNFTKAVLEVCTGQLVALGLTRRRRGLATWDLNDEMTGGIALQVQPMRSGAIRILPSTQVVWEPVERLVAHGKGEGYRPWTTPTITRSRLHIPPKDLGPFEFTDPEIDSKSLDRLAYFVRAQLIDNVLALADERDMIRHFRTNAGRRVAGAEHALAILAWQSKSLELFEDFGSLLQSQSEHTGRTQLAAFHERLTISPEAQALLYR